MCVFIFGCWDLFKPHQNTFLTAPDQQCVISSIILTGYSLASLFTVRCDNQSAPPTVQ